MSGVEWSLQDTGGCITVAGPGRQSDINEYAPPLRQGSQLLTLRVLMA